VGEPLPDQRQPSSRAGCGEAEAHATELSQLFERHNRTLVAFLVNRLGSEAEAKEVAQEAYVRLLQLHQPGAVSFLRAYLFRTAANIALDRIRHRVRSERLEQTYDDEDLTDQLGPDRQVLARDSLQMVRQALLELPPGYRRAFLLSRFSDKSTEDIGRELGIRSTQTRLYLRRAVAYCRLRMDGLPEAEARERVFQ
jgi:RNA polymerase sigma-70 factor (ECF subfamily)